MKKITKYYIDYTCSKHKLQIINKYRWYFPNLVYNQNVPMLINFYSSIPNNKHIILFKILDSEQREECVGFRCGVFFIPVYIFSDKRSRVRVFE